MKLFLFILAVVLWVGVKSKAAASKRAADLESTSDSESANSPFRQSVFESLFNEFKDVVDDFSDAEASERPETSASTTENSFYEEFSGAETTIVDDQPQVSESASAPIVESLPEAQPFDLRQAVIYQTILSNKYLDEIRSHDN